MIFHSESHSSKLPNKSTKLIRKRYLLSTVIKNRIVDKDYIYMGYWYQCKVQLLSIVMSHRAKLIKGQYQILTLTLIILHTIWEDVRPIWSQVTTTTKKKSRRSLDNSTKKYSTTPYAIRKSSRKRGMVPQIYRQKRDPFIGKGL